MGRGGVVGGAPLRGPELRGITLAVLPAAVANSLVGAVLVSAVWLAAVAFLQLWLGVFRAALFGGPVVYRVKAHAAIALLGAVPAMVAVRGRARVAQPSQHGGGRGGGDDAGDCSGLVGDGGDAGGGGSGGKHRILGAALGYRVRVQLLVPVLASLCRPEVFGTVAVAAGGVTSSQIRAVGIFHVGFAALSFLQLGTRVLYLAPLRGPVVSLIIAYAHIARRRAGAPVVAVRSRAGIARSGDEGRGERGAGSGHLQHGGAERGSHHCGARGRGVHGQVWAFGGLGVGVRVFVPNQTPL